MKQVYSYNIIISGYYNVKLSSFCFGVKPDVSL